MLGKIVSIVYINELMKFKVRLNFYGIFCLFYKFVKVLIVDWVGLFINIWKMYCV